MSKSLHNRPTHLPDFKSPPLSEVVIGVQFTPPNGYKQILSGEVWSLYKENYPRVEEQAPLEPVFEVFGLSNFSPLGQFKFLTGASHDRFWFLSKEGTELIQFQNDRFLHNWRENLELKNSYPRFEYMLSKFNDELAKLEGFMQGVSGEKLSINQCEVSYINNIITQNDSYESPSQWLDFCDFKLNKPDDFNFIFREIIYDAENKPEGRLTVEAVSAINQNNQNMIRFTLTVRGAPKSNTAESALEFLQKGREIIVVKFAELTTSFAHDKWGRVK